MRSLEVTGATRLLGIIGHPVSHSLSPCMQNAALVELGLDCLYVPLLVHPSRLKTAVAGLQACGFIGFSVTIPHKQTITSLMDRLTEPAQLARAVNTVRIEPDGTLTGTNTDIGGFVQPLANSDWLGKTATVLGNGGAALAVAIGCRQLGFECIHVCGRDHDKLHTFCSGNAALEGVKPVLWSELDHVLPRTDLLVNTTPVGMVPTVEESPLSVENLSHLPEQATVYDLIYRPRPTRLLEMATGRGLMGIDGSAMLVAQGEVALEFWLGRPAPVGIMAQAVRTALN